MIDATVIGLSLGCIYGMVGAGFSLVYRTTGVLSFAQGAFVMVGAMACSWSITSWHFPLGVAILFGLAVAALSGVVMAVTTVLPLWRRDSGEFVVILATALFLTICENLALRLLGSSPRSVPAITSGGFHFAGSVISHQFLYVVGFGLVLGIVFPIYLNRTRVGFAMRACAIDREIARTVGISPTRTALLAFAIVAALTGLAGCLIAPIQFTAYNVGTAYNTYGFIAAMLGGLGSIQAALGGGLALGLIQSYIGVYLTTRYLDSLLLLLLVLVLIFRPSGIFSRPAPQLAK